MRKCLDFVLINLGKRGKVGEENGIMLKKRCVQDSTVPANVLFHNEVDDARDESLRKRLLCDNPFVVQVDEKMATIRIEGKDNIMVKIKSPESSSPTISSRNSNKLSQLNSPHVFNPKPSSKKKINPKISKKQKNAQLTNSNLFLKNQKPKASTKPHSNLPETKRTPTKSKLNLSSNPNLKAGNSTSYYSYRNTSEELREKEIVISEINEMNELNEREYARVNKLKKEKQNKTIDTGRELGMESNYGRINTITGISVLNGFKSNKGKSMSNLTTQRKRRNNNPPTNLPLFQIQFHNGGNRNCPNFDQEDEHHGLPVFNVSTGRGRLANQCEQFDVSPNFNKNKSKSPKLKSKSKRYLNLLPECAKKNVNSYLPIKNEAKINFQQFPIISPNLYAFEKKHRFRNESVYNKKEKLKYGKWYLNPDEWNSQFKHMRNKSTPFQNLEQNSVISKLLKETPTASQITQQKLDSIQKKKYNMDNIMAKFLKPSTLTSINKFENSK